MGTCPDAIKRLIDRFEQQSDQIRSPDYNETLIRVDFINPLMTELGWDMENRQGFAERYREVVHEDRVKVAGQTKAPDYSFRVGGTRKFFLEAKKPAVDIKNNWEPAYQLRRYAWSAKLACSLLTDFEEFAIYDTRIQPKQLEKASVARREYISYTDYPDRWDFLEGTFSKDAVLKGEFDRYCESKKGRGAQLFDDAFLSEIEEWRKSLASSLARHNESLDEPALNFAVQRIIDRIIFLRIAEDRGTENVGQLQALIGGEKVYPRLVTLFNRADERYNSGLFHFAKEKDRDEAPDTLTRSLDVDDKTLKGIIKALYYPESPYEFTMVSADILGSIYERFLGKVITLTAGHNAKIEEKPEVRKAGGVYYTPNYIVDYIVKNTVGKLLEGKTPKEAAKIKVLDPACGSGSFLIGAYQFLLDWYLEQYTAADPKKIATGKNPRLRQTTVSPFKFVGERLGVEKAYTGWALTIDERKRILLDHIHGVDLDGQAVEVTKLNLLLKCLEGETSQTLGFSEMYARSHNRALPDLGKNILCGNSLIGTDIIGTRAWTTMSEERRGRINPFDYERAFSQVFKGGRKFDAVIGNPPYIFTRELMTEAERDYYASRFVASWEKQNTFMLFMERAEWMTDDDGLFSYIVPNSWLTVESAKLLRKLLRSKLLVLLDLNYGVFESVSMEPCIFICGKYEASALSAARIESSEAFAAPVWQVIDHANWDSSGRITFTEMAGLDPLLARVTASSTSVGEAFDVRTGLQAYEAGKGTPKQTPADVRDHVFDRDRKDSNETYRYLEGRDVRRYERVWSGMWMRYGPWLSQPRSIDIFSRPRVIIREITAPPPKCLNATLESEVYLSNKSVLTVLHTGDDVAKLKTLVAVLNSRFISAFYKGRAVKGARLVFPKIVIKNLREFPFPKTLAGHVEKRLVALVDNMLSLNKRLATEKSPQRREQIQREIDATDRQIDQLVYQLYGLTDKEIAIVEAATA